jgi:hypothetical protein
MFETIMKINITGGITLKGKSYNSIKTANNTTNHVL